MSPKFHFDPFLMVVKDFKTQRTIYLEENTEFMKYRSFKLS